MNVEDLTVSWTENGVEKVRELNKTVLSTSTSWATIAFLFQENDGEGGWRAPKVSIRRYRKRGKGFVVDKHLTLSTAKQAVALADAIKGWFPNPPASSEGDVVDEE
jgi:hypothetical protein